MTKRAIVSAIVLLLVGVVLGTTVFREQVAQAAQSLSATIVGPLDDKGNVAVHEQGTADVNVTGGNLAIAREAPIARGGSAVVIATGSTYSVSQPAVATALSIHMQSEVTNLTVLTKEGIAATFMGPRGDFGNSSIVLALTRPITFDGLFCNGSPGGNCTVSWVGAEP
jgi:hypothetical protein